LNFLSNLGTLAGLAAGLQMYLQNKCNRRNMWLLKKDDENFKLFRDALDKRRKELIASGVGIVPKQADPITNEDEEQLWNSGTFNTNTSQGLSYLVYFYNCKVFGFRAKDEHVELLAEQFSFGSDKGKKFMQYSGRLAKNMTGAFSSKATPRIVKHYADSTNPRCLVGIYELYLSMIPATGRFYRRPLPSVSGISFSSVHVGVNKLCSYMHDMFVAAKIDLTNRFITGHSGKVTCCTNLYKSNFDDQAIKLRSGHRSEAVRAYKRPSEELLHELSVALQPPRPVEQSLTHDDKKDDLDYSACSTGFVDSRPAHGAALDCSVKCLKSETKSGVSDTEVVYDSDKILSSSSQNTMVISVPSCVTKVVVMRNGKTITLEL
jgi:hypothetical protein